MILELGKGSVLVILLIPCSKNIKIYRGKRCLINFNKSFFECFADVN